jgi:hypothetical protein
MARNFRELETKMSPESRGRSRALYEKYRAEMPSHLLREAREMTQVHLAKVLGVNQAAVSKLERRADIREHATELCEGDGRGVEDHGSVSEGTVEINQFEDVKKAAGE